MTLRLSLLVLLLSGCAPEERARCPDVGGFSVSPPDQRMLALSGEVPQFGGGFREPNVGVKWIALLTDTSVENIQALAVAWEKDVSSLIVRRAAYTYLELAGIHGALSVDGDSPAETIHRGIDITRNRYVITVAASSECSDGADMDALEAWLGEKGVDRAAILVETSTTVFAHAL